MPRREWWLRVRDMLDAIDAIEQFTGDLDAEAFEQDQRTVAAVLYELTLIGEAARLIPEDVREQHPEIAWRRLRETRNFVTHVYFGVDARRIWQIVQRRLPALRGQLAEVLADEGEAEG